MTEYTIKSTNESSQKYGPCEVCGRHATEVYHQMAKHGKAYNGDLFGHYDCLMAQREQE